MTAIVEFFEYISELFKSAADFFVNYITNVIKFFAAIPEAIEILNGCIAWLPTYVIPFAMCFLAVSVIVVVIRR